MKLWNIFLVFALYSNLQSNGQNEKSPEDLVNLLKTNPRMFETELQNVFSCLKKLIKDGFLGISLDPFKLPLFPLKLDNSVVSSDLLLTIISFEGLSNFILNPAEVNLDWGQMQPHLNLGLSFQSFKLGTNYDGTLKLMEMINLFGKGNFRLELDNLGLNLEVKLSIFPIKITYTKITLRLPSTNVCKVTGLFNDDYMSDIVSIQMHDTLNSLVIEQQANLNTLINNAVEQLVATINPTLEGLNLDDIISAITGIIGGGGGGGGEGGGGGIELNCEAAFMKAVTFINETFGDSWTNRSMFYYNLV
ncbi:hypothetical protein RI129_004291 [Pyrocoelia pectoralis]|uniref:Uncharacterized protein n=1 Tax=Pyrocoelia pectoralis TaxID=417401 RepID=A0AAN7ZJ57_9COLE